jgi:hypothetical protein
VPPVGGAANVLADGLTSTLPPALLSGSRLKGKAALHVTNRSAATVAGAAVVTVYLSADDLVDAADAQLAVLRTTLRVPAGAGKNLNVKLGGVLPPVPDGTYKLLATLRRPDLGTDAVATGNTVRVAAPMIDLRPTAATLAPARAARGRTVTVALTLENRGNVAARGGAAVTLSARPTAATDAAPAPPVTVPAKLNLPPGRSGTVRVKFVVPPELPPGEYELLAELGAGSLGGGATVTVVDPTPIVTGVLVVT